LKRAQEVIVTPDMHVRKQTMFDRADAFVALPGGIGTLEELVEQLTWAQLGRHKKPILILNIKKFWDPLCALLDHMRRLEFIRADLAVALLTAERPDDILPKLRQAARREREREARQARNRRTDVARRPCQKGRIAFPAQVSGAGARRRGARAADQNNLYRLRPAGGGVC
jgi:hypothetical protein